MGTVTVSSTTSLYPHPDRTGLTGDSWVTHGHSGAPAPSRVEGVSSTPLLPLEFSRREGRRDAGEPGSVPTCVLPESLTGTQPYSPSEGVELTSVQCGVIPGVKGVDIGLGSR